MNKNRGVDGEGAKGRWEELGGKEGGETGQDVLKNNKIIKNN